MLISLDWPSVKQLESQACLYPSLSLSVCEFFQDFPSSSCHSEQISVDKLEADLAFDQGRAADLSNV